MIVSVVELYCVPLSLILVYMFKSIIDNKVIFLIIRLYPP